MALLRHARRSSSAWLSYAVTGAAVAAAGVEPVLLVLTERRLLPIWPAVGWGVAVTVAVVAWVGALLVRRRRHRRGVRMVGQWVRSARIEGGQFDGLAAVRAGGPLAGERASGWLSLERELVRFRPDPRCGRPDACWAVPWHAVAVVDVSAAPRLRDRLLPGLRRSQIGLRMRGNAATLLLEVDEDPRVVLRTWVCRGVGHSPRRSRRADR